MPYLREVSKLLTRLLEVELVDREEVVVPMDREDLNRVVFESALHHFSHVLDYVH